MRHPVGRRDERRRDTRQFGQRPADVRDVVEHEVGRCDVKLAVGKRQVLHVADLRVDVPGAGELDHPLRLVDRDDLEAATQQPLCQLPAAAADLQHARRRQSDDLLDGDVERLRARARGPEGRADGEV
jgi:hypothetical protein